MYFKLDLPRWCTNRFRDHSTAVPFSDFRSKQETAGQSFKLRLSWKKLEGTYAAIKSIRISEIV